MNHVVLSLCCFSDDGANNNNSFEPYCYSCSQWALMSGHFALSRVMFPCSVLCVLHNVYVVVVMCIYYWLQTKLPHGDMKAFPYLTLLINTFKKQKQV